MVDETIRINKYIKECGIASRREADALIESGRVAVNGKTASSGLQVKHGDIVTLDGVEIKLQHEKHVVAFYKPIGVVCTAKDKNASLIISDVFDYPVNLTYAGRLDKDSEGLLIMTDDGDLIDRMMRSRNNHEKEYEVTMDRAITEDFVTCFSKGLWLDELEVKTKPCFVEKIGKYSVRIILTQGLNRQIRRMSSVLGYKVKELKRVRVVNVELGKLKPGEYRELSSKEIEELKKTLK